MAKYGYHDHNNDAFNALRAEFTQLQTKRNTKMTFYWFILVIVNAWHNFFYELHRVDIFSPRLCKIWVIK